MKQKVTAIAPINIALCKYWGKRDTTHVLPYTDSISITLDDFYTETTIKRTTDIGFTYTLNGEELTNEALKKVLDFCKQFYADIEKLPISIESKNTGPTAAGLASSASAFAALAIALNDFFETGYNLHEVSKLTRQGSGSAVRSLLDGFVLWTRNGDIKKLCDSPNDVVIVAVIIDRSFKTISSRKAMNIGVKTSPFYDDFVKKNQTIANQMVKEICPFRLSEVGNLMEESTELMHQVMATSSPRIHYKKDSSKRLQQLVKDWRIEGIQSYATMDAGPNVKILTTKEHLSQIIKRLEANEYNDYHILQAGQKARVINSE